MNRTTIFLIVSLTLSFSSFAQINPPDTLWTNTLGAAGFDEGRCVQQTDDGGYIIVGSHFIGGSLEVYLVKTDSLGNSLWYRLYGGDFDDAGFSVQQTMDGGYIIAGYTESFGAGGSDVYLIKTNANGDTLWASTYGGSLDDRGYSVQQDTIDGGYIITGYFTEQGRGKDVYLIKTDSWGFVQEQNTFGGMYDDVGNCVQMTPDSGYFITGYTSNSAGSTDVYLIKTFEGGGLDWEQTYGDPLYSDAGNSGHNTPDGGHIITGYTRSGITDEEQQIYVVRTNSEGDTIWTSSMGTEGDDAGHSIIPATEGGHIITGYSTPGISDSLDAMLLVYIDEDSGNVIWIEELGGGGDERGFSVKECAEGGFVITGFTDSYGTGDEDMWLVKLDAMHDLIVELTPYGTPIVIPETGGNVNFDIEIINNTTSLQTFDIDIQVHYLGQVPFMVSILNYQLNNFAPSASLIRNRDFEVPEYAPGGQYRCYAFVGDTIWTVEDYDWFDFEKEGEDDGYMGSPSDWICTGELFPGEARANYQAPESYAILNVSPNPFNAKTVISCKLQAASCLNLVIYDIMGREVVNLFDGFYEAGYCEVVWDASGLPSGVYFVRLRAGDIHNTQKILLIK